MDTLVARYSAPPSLDQPLDQDEQQELMQTAPPLSLKFALPPIAQVSLDYYRSSISPAFRSLIKDCSHHLGSEP